MFGKKGRELVRAIYSVTELFPSKEKFGLTDQIRRAAISVPSNIAESSGRIGSKDRLRFLNFAYGSLMEIRCQLFLAEDLGYLSAEHNIKISNIIVETSRMISAMRQKLQNEQ
ncbi:MAG: four helix bundle protein [Bacteroides sp.]|nr:four helix bundle protein [Bacteroides sp.]MCM1380188.1 four helix bundle protein [Bacteroides sp.]MCM1446497.1 four helix bundle protein [Prevotella sp.]